MEVASVDAAVEADEEHDESKHLCHTELLVVAVAPFSCKHRKLSWRLCFCVYFLTHLRKRNSIDRFRVLELFSLSFFRFFLCTTIAVTVFGSHHEVSRAVKATFRCSFETELLSTTILWFHSGVGENMFFFIIFLSIFLVF